MSAASAATKTRPSPHPAPSGAPAKKEQKEHKGAPNAGTASASSLGSASPAAAPSAMPTFNAPSGWKGFLEKEHGDQAIFTTMTAKTVVFATEMVAKFVKGKKDLDVFFPRFWEFLSTERRKVAKAQNEDNPDVPLFGLWADKVPPGKGTLETDLVEHYQPYGTRVLEFIQRRLHDMLTSMGPDMRKGNYFKGWGNDKSLYYVRVIPYSQLKTFIESYERQEHECRVPVCKVKTKDLDFEVQHDHFHIAFSRLFQANKLNLKIDKVALVVGACVLKVNNVWTTTSMHLTWLNIDDGKPLSSRAIDEMSTPDLKFFISSGKMCLGTKSSVHILHGIGKNVRLVMKEVNTLAKRAALWDGKDQNELFDTVAEMQHLLNLQTPWARGGGNIPENAQRALLGSHDIQVLSHTPDVNMFFESHAHPLTSVFKKNYRNYFVWKKVEAPKAPAVAITAAAPNFEELGKQLRELSPSDLKSVLAKMKKEQFLPHISESRSMRDQIFAFLDNMPAKNMLDALDDADRIAGMLELYCSRFNSSYAIVVAGLFDHLASTKEGMAKLQAVLPKLPIASLLMDDGMNRDTWSYNKLSPTVKEIFRGYRDSR